MDPIQERVQDGKNSRPIFLYEIPTQYADGIKTVGLVQLSAREEMLAAKRSGSDPIRLVYEQVKQSLVEVNGEKVSLADGTSDRAFDTMAPMVRSMILSAFSKLHTPPEDAVSGFLESQTVRVA